MTITPRDLRNKQFDMGLRGYDPTDVRDYLEEVAQELERLRKNKNDLEGRLRVANERLQTVSKRENQVQGLLETAEKTAKDRLAAIQSKGQAMLSQAHAEAEEIVMRARRDRDEIRQDVANLTAQRERFHAELKAQLRAHAELLVRTGGGGGAAEPEAPRYDAYEVGEVAEILEGPSAVDVDLGGRRKKARNGSVERRRIPLRRSSDRARAKPQAAN